MLTDLELQDAYDSGLTDVVELPADGRQPTHGEAARLGALRAVQTAVRADFAGAVLDAVRHRVSSKIDARSFAVNSDADHTPAVDESLDRLAAVLNAAFNDGASILVAGNGEAWAFTKGEVGRIVDAAFSAQDITAWQSTGYPRFEGEPGNQYFCTAEYVTKVSFASRFGRAVAHFRLVRPTADLS